MHNGSGRPTFLICTVSPKAVLWRFFSACFSLRHLNVTQQVWQQILIPALQSQLEPSVPYSGTLKDMDLHGLSSIQTWGVLTCGQRQLSMAGAQDAIASFWGIFMCR